MVQRCRCVAGIGGHCRIPRRISIIALGSVPQQEHDQPGAHGAFPRFRYDFLIYSKRYSNANNVLCSALPSVLGIIDFPVDITVVNPDLLRHEQLSVMRDPNLNMEQNHTGQEAIAPAAEPRRSRVTFGPATDADIRPRDESPRPLTAHHRSLTSIETQRLDLTSTPARPNSSGENTGAADGPPDRASVGRPAPALQRTKSDYGPRSGVDRSVSGDDDDFAMRHGWQEEYTSSEYLKILHSVSPVRPVAPCFYRRLTLL